MTANLFLYATGCNSIGFDEIRSIVEEEHDLVEVQSNSFSIKLDSDTIRFEICVNDLFESKVVVISVNSMTQELVAQAWEFLIAIFIQSKEFVWISTYSRQYLSQFGEVKELVFNGTTGFLVSPEVFDKMVS